MNPTRFWERLPRQSKVIEAQITVVWFVKLPGSTFDMAVTDLV